LGHVDIRGNVNFPLFPTSEWRICEFIGPRTQLLPLIAFLGTFATIDHPKSKLHFLMENEIGHGSSEIIGLIGTKITKYSP
jgi:hypothetical protein